MSYRQYVYKYTCGNCHCAKVHTGDSLLERSEIFVLEAGEPTDDHL